MGNYRDKSQPVPVPMMSCNDAAAAKESGLRKRTRSEEALAALKEVEEHEEYQRTTREFLTQNAAYMGPVFRGLSQHLFRWFQHQGFWPKDWNNVWDLHRADEQVRLKKMEKLGLIVTEIAECMEAVRKNDDRNEREEISDALVRIFDYIGGFGHADLITTAFIQKMFENVDREHRHGKQF